MFDVSSSDVVYLASPYTFDPSIVQMFLSFSNGAQLLITPQTTKLIPEKLCKKLVDQHHVTILQVKYAYIYAFPTLRYTDIPIFFVNSRYYCCVLARGPSHCVHNSVFAMAVLACWYLHCVNFRITLFHFPVLKKSQRDMATQSSRSEKKKVVRVWILQSLALALPRNCNRENKPFLLVQVTFGSFLKTDSNFSCL